MDKACQSMYNYVGRILRMTEWLAGGAINESI